MDNQCECFNNEDKSFICLNAADAGHLECLRYAHEAGYPWDERTTGAAAWNGHLECLRYAHEQGCPWNEDVLGNAATCGHLKCLKYLHENGCPGDGLAFCGAAYYGHYECIEYGHKNDYPWNTWITRNAYNGSQFRILLYAIANGCPYDGILPIHIARVLRETGRTYSSLYGCRDSHTRKLEWCYQLNMGKLVGALRQRGRMRRLQIPTQI